MVTNRGNAVKVDIPAAEDDWYKKSLMEKWKEHYEKTKDNPDSKRVAAKTTCMIILTQAPTMIYVFSCYIIPYLLEGYDYWTQYTLKVFIIYSWVQLIANYAFCFFYDTSIRKTRDRPDLPGVDNRWDSPPDRFVPLLETSNGHVPNGVLDDNGIQLKYCEKCEIYKPLRTHHCKKCDKCILMRDHHCYIVGTCIGYKNQRYFVMVNFWTVIVSVIGFAFTVEYLKQIYWPLAESWTDYFLPLTIWRWIKGEIAGRYALMIYHLYIEVAFGLITFFFFNVQMTLICKGKTLYELAKEVPIKVFSNTNAHFVSVFGHFWLLNFLFPMQIIFKQPHDGTKWKDVKIDYNYEKDLTS